MCRLEAGGVCRLEECVAGGVCRLDECVAGG